jgi:bifunctional N-acetylglucosamine-1-phosphate-uridyltransferase/glucosamine-1-phosphate-acetyltransferase GlmU-like protein
MTAETFNRVLAALDDEVTLAVSTFDANTDDDVGRILLDASGSAVAVGQPRLGGKITAQGDGGLYGMQPAPTLQAFDNVCDENVRREFSLPDVVEVLAREGHKVLTVRGPRDDFVSVNTPAQLSTVRMTALPTDRQNAFAGRFGLSVTDYLEVARSQVGPLFNVDDPWS